MSEDGEENLITSGKVVHYNKSSGTVGNPKRIPLTEEAFQVFQKYNGPYRMGLVAKELGEDWINGRNMSIAESIAEIQHVKSGVTYGALSVKMIGEFRPYLGMSFTSPDEAIYPESETNTRYLHARFGLMDQYCVIWNRIGSFWLMILNRERLIWVLKCQRKSVPVS